MFAHVRVPSVARGKRARLPVLPTSYDDDAMLLSSDSQIPRSLALVPERELKYFDKYVDTFSVASPGTWTGCNPWNGPTSGTLSSPVVGDRAIDRKGRAILMKSLHISGLLAMQPEATKFSQPIPQFVALAVILDTQCNGAVVSGDTVFTQYGGDLSTCFPPTRNMETNTRFQVLRSEMLKMGPNAFTIDATAVPPEFSWSGDQACFDWFIPLDFVVNFNAGTTDSYASVIDNVLYFYAVSTGGSLIEATWKSRLRFFDLFN